jgi:hypothetical protein
MINKLLFTTTLFLCFCQLSAQKQQIYVVDSKSDVNIVAYDNGALGYEDLEHSESEVYIEELFANISLVSSDDKIKDCQYKDIPLYGKVKFVSSFPDFKVKIVNSFPDLKVKYVDSFPDSCGKWKIVESFPDFTIQIVESFPDFTIKVVESFPGMP